MAALFSICLCTYRRPNGVTKAILSLGCLQAPEDSLIEIVVVDNDVEGSAQDAVEEAAKASQWPVRYFIERDSGVSHARNRCLKEASGQYVAFIDDDEWCDPDWVVRLFVTLKTANATAAFGPVIPSFDEPPCDWLEESGVFERRRFSSGTIIDWRHTRTGNVLLIRDPELIGSGFDPAYSSTGGEDVAFFLQLKSRGARYVWCDEAPVYENVPKNRMAPGWILHRGFLGGKKYVRIRATDEGRLTYLTMWLRGLVGFFCFTTAAICIFPVMRASGFRFARRAAGDLGKMAAVFASGRGPYGN